MRTAPTHAHIEETKRLNAYMCIHLYLYPVSQVYFALLWANFCYFPTCKLLRGIFRYRTPSKRYTTQHQTDQQTKYEARRKGRHENDTIVKLSLRACVCVCVCVCVSEPFSLANTHIGLDSARHPCNLQKLS